MHLEPAICDTARACQYRYTRQGSLGEGPKNLRRAEHGIVQGERRGRLAVRVLGLLRSQKLLPRSLGAEPASTSVEHPSLEKPDHCGHSSVSILDAGALQSEAPSLPQMLWDRLAFFLQLGVWRK